MKENIIKTRVTGIGDPFVLPYEGAYYMYATSAKDGFRVFVSDDLREWRDGGLCYGGSAWGEGDFWAPEVYARGGRFYMFFTARWKEKHSLRISAAVADKPEGPFRDVAGKPVFDFGYAAIDGAVLDDGGGRAYLYYARDCSENIVGGKHVSQIYGVELEPSWTAVKGEPILLSTPEGEWETPPGDWLWNEGPAVLKRGGVYYMAYSVNHFASRFYSVCYAKSAAPLGPFAKAAENPILKYIDGEISGPGHNSFFTAFDGRLMTAYHIHTDYGAPSGDRRACFSVVNFDAAGRLVIDYKENAARRRER
jgi:GH43 family beta-xylosidase